jgi:hypothetical protein
MNKSVSDGKSRGGGERKGETHLSGGRAFSRTDGEGRRGSRRPEELGRTGVAWSVYLIGSRESTSFFSRSVFAHTSTAIVRHLSSRNPTSPMLLSLDRGFGSRRPEELGRTGVAWSVYLIGSRESTSFFYLYLVSPCRAPPACDYLADPLHLSWKTRVHLIDRLSDDSHTAKGVTCAMAAPSPK